MTNPSVQVIDLTDSFSLVDHGSLADVIIVLDDSLNESSVTVNAPVASETETDAPIEVLSTITTSENDAPRPVRLRKKSKAKKKVESLTPNDLRQSIRERSPLSNYIEDCPICLERMGTNPLVSTKCGHVFCQQCLIGALRLEKKCPTCRRPLRGNAAFHPLFLGRR